MIEHDAVWFHYLAIAFAVSISALGSGIGVGIAGNAALDALDRQPKALKEIRNLLILGIALIEAAGLFGVIVATLMLYSFEPTKLSIFTAIGEIGIACSIGMTGLAVGIMSSLPVKASCLALAQQPFFRGSITRFMITAQSFIQAPVIFGFIFALIIKSRAATATTLAESIQLIAVGTAIGLGTIGPTIGLGIFSSATIKSLGLNRNAYNVLLKFLVISQALIETPVTFALVISAMILAKKATSILSAVAMLSAAIAIGLGTIGPGIGSGYTGAATAEVIGKNPDNYRTLLKVSVFSQGFIDAAAIYAFIIGIFILILA